MLNKWYNVIINSPLIYVFYIQNELIAIEIDTAKEQRLCVICQVHMYMNIGVWFGWINWIVENNL